MIARLGGDEFGLIFEAAEASAIDAVCRKALASCAANFSVHGCEIDLTSSAGYVRSGDHRSRDAVDLVRYADIALYAAKHKGRNRACRFDTEMDESAKFRHLVETGLRQAIARDELSLLYQPIVDRNSLNIVGFEALLRWNSQEHGDISPQVFVPIAEEGPLIQEIGDWVMDKAIAESRNWQQHYVSINLSVRQLGRADLVERLCQLAARHGALHDNIQLEVTETALFENAELAATKLQTLRGLGFRIALDDFGTGYSTMSNIKNFAIDCIKIDKSFIDDLGNDNQSAAIVASGRKDGQITVRGETVSHGRGAVFTQRWQGQGRDCSGGDPRGKPSGARYFSVGLTVWATPFDNGKGRPIVLSTAPPAPRETPMLRPYALLALFAAASPAAPPGLSRADEAAAFRAAGFTRTAGKWQACGDPGTASYTPGTIETVRDINGDGRPDAVITEGSVFCFGGTEAGYSVVSKQANGSWRQITGGPGVATFLPRAAKTRTASGWPDLEIGGPGFCFRVQRWNGREYVHHRYQYEGKPCRPPR